MKWFKTLIERMLGVKHYKSESHSKKAFERGEMEPVGMTTSEKADLEWLNSV